MLQLATLVEGDSKVTFQLQLHQDVRKVDTPFPGLLFFTLNPYFIMLSVKQGDVMYHFL